MDTLSLNFNIDFGELKGIRFEDINLKIRDEKKEEVKPITNQTLGDEVRKFKFCRGCGNKLPISSRFCDRCGENVEYD